MRAFLNTTCNFNFKNNNTEKMRMFVGLLLLLHLVANSQPQTTVSPLAGCVVCDKDKGIRGDLTQLTLVFLGGEGSSIPVSSSDAFVAPTVIKDGELLTLQTKSEDEKLKANTELILSGVAIEIHTSCSKPLVVGQRFPIQGVGVLEIVGFNMRLETGKKTFITRTEEVCAPEEEELRRVSSADTEACDACATGQGLHMLRFQINAGGTELTNPQNGQASVTGTPMPTGAADEDGECVGTLLQIGENADLCTFPGLCEINVNGCSPWGASLVCFDTNNSTEQYMVNSFEYGALNNLDGQTEPSESKTQFITDGTLVVVHNEGKPMAEQITCTLRSATDICFGFSADSSVQIHQPGCADDVMSSKGSSCACWPDNSLEELNPHLSFSQTISIDTSCAGNSLSVGDEFGMFELVGFLDAGNRDDVACGTCVNSPSVNTVCVGPRFDGSFDSSQTICHIEDTSFTVQTECLEEDIFVPRQGITTGCNICEEKGDKITSLTLQWVANVPGTPANISVQGKKSDSKLSLSLTTIFDGSSAVVSSGNFGDSSVDTSGDSESIDTSPNDEESPTSRKSSRTSYKSGNKMAKRKKLKTKSTKKRGTKGSKDAKGQVFPTNIEININGEIQELHTSCSKPIVTGDVLDFSTGTLTIVGFNTFAGYSLANCTGSRRRRQIGNDQETCQCGPKDPMYCLRNIPGGKCCSHYWQTCAISLWIQEYPQFNYLSFDVAYNNMGVNTDDNTCELAQFNTNGVIDSVVPILGLYCYSQDVLLRYVDSHSESFAQTLSEFLSLELSPGKSHGQRISASSLLLAMLVFVSGTVVIAVGLALKRRYDEPPIETIPVNSPMEYIVPVSYQGWHI
eukprot:m.341385 g.341385  ORF g.341385 m.341385 type:complete len:854 (-) comp20080_c0_seq1:115-2676(-)